MFNERNSKKKWKVSTEGMDYIKLREFLDSKGWDVEIPVFGYYINTLKNGEAVTIISNDCMINLPSHAVKWFKACTTEEDAAIAEGKLILKNFKELKTDYGNMTIIYDYADPEE